MSILTPKCPPRSPVWCQTPRRKLYILQAESTPWPHQDSTDVTAEGAGVWSLLCRAALFRGLHSVFQSVEDHFVQSESGTD